MYFLLKSSGPHSPISGLFDEPRDILVMQFTSPEQVVSKPVTTSFYRNEESSPVFSEEMFYYYNIFKKSYSHQLLAPEGAMKIE
jgi:hypothetical protein